MRVTHFIDKDPNIYEALAELQKQNIQSMNEEQVLKIVDDFEFRWYLNPEIHSNCLERSAMLGYRQFVHPDNFDDDGFPHPDRFDIMAVLGIKQRMINFLIQLTNHVQANGKGYEDLDLTIKRINYVILQIEDGFENVRRHRISYERVNSPTALPQVRRHRKFNTPPEVSDALTQRSL